MAVRTSARRRGAAVYGANINKVAGTVRNVNTQRLPQTGGGAFVPYAPGNDEAQATPDAQYIAEAAKRAFERQQQLQQLNSQDANDTTDTNEQRRRYDENVVKQVQASKQNAAKAGLFYSGTLGKQLGEQETAATRQRSDMATQLARRQSARAAARQALEQGADLDEAAAYAASIDRQIDRDSSAAELGALAPLPAENPFAPRTRAPVQRKKSKPAAKSRTVSRKAPARKPAKKRRR